MPASVDNRFRGDRLPVWAELRELARHPVRYFVLGWNWKTAAFSAMSRSTIFLVAMMKRGGRAEISTALILETMFSATAAGVYGAFIQAMRFARPAWLARLVISLCLPLVMAGLDYLLHWVSGMHDIRTSIVATWMLSVVSSLFSFYIMQRGAFVVGQKSDSLWQDLARIPLLIVQFVVAGPRYLWNQIARMVRKGESELPNPNEPSRPVRMLAAALFVFAAAWPLSAQSDASAPDVAHIVDQLVQRNRVRADQLKEYESCRYYALAYSGFPSRKTAGMVVAMKFNAPAKKEFRIVREEGSLPLVHHVLKQLLDREKESGDEQNREKSSLTPTNYEFQFLNTEMVEGRQQYVLSVTPRTNNRFLYRGKIWVDAADYAVSHVSAEPAKNPSLFISHTEIEHFYTKVGEFWLPARNTSVTKVRMGGTAKLEIQYANYRIGVSALSPAEACADQVQAAAAAKR
jgi:hypothetical protein